MKMSHGIHAGNVHEKVKFTRTESICPYLLFVSHGASSAICLPNKEN